MTLPPLIFNVKIEHLLFFATFYIDKQSDKDMGVNFEIKVLHWGDF